MAKLELDQVSKHYGPVRAVEGVSLHVATGETVVLLGPSGCGKTTLLRMIAGFFRPDGGSIQIGGQVVASDRTMVPPEKRSLSMVFQSYAVWPHKTVFENVAYGLRLKALQGTALRAKVDEALSLVRMQGHADHYPGDLSGGQQQRVALARAIALEPEILLFDEPLSNLDAALREHMRFEIKALLTRLQITAVYVTHDQNEAMVVGDRIAVMNAGRIEQVGTPEDIYYGSKTEFVARFVGLANVYDAEILKREDPDLVRVTVAGLGEMVARAFVPVEAGQPVRLFVRPEGVSFESHGEAQPNRYRSRVTQRTFLGSHVDYMLDVNGVPIRAISSAENGPLRVGEETSIALSPARSFVLAGEA